MTGSMETFLFLFRLLEDVQQQARTYNSERGRRGVDWPVRALSQQLNLTSLPCRILEDAVDMHNHTVSPDLSTFLLMLTSQLTVWKSGDCNQLKPLFEAASFNETQFNTLQARLPRPAGTY
jgi:hypothetical protein